jgi:hypothetical protein
VYDFGFRECAVQIAEGFPTFRQTLQLPPSGLMFLGTGSSYTVVVSVGESDVKL